MSKQQSPSPARDRLIVSVISKIEMEKRDKLLSLADTWINRSKEPIGEDFIFTSGFNRALVECSVELAECLKLNG